MMLVSGSPCYLDEYGILDIIVESVIQWTVICY